jgi:hypothetical protein
MRLTRKVTKHIFNGSIVLLLRYIAIETIATSLGLISVVEKGRAIRRASYGTQHLPILTSGSSISSGGHLYLFTDMALLAFRFRTCYYNVVGEIWSYQMS